ncbi:MAG: DUF4340 domain-containing protein [Verrucomicrobiota bacterium]
MKKYGTLFIYGLVAAGLLAYLLLVDSDTLSTDQAKNQQERLFDFTANDVTRVRLQRGPEVVVLEQAQPGVWRMTEPVESAAANNVLRQMLNEMAYVRKVREEPMAAFGEDRSERLREIGLQPPVVEATLDANGESHHLRLGRQLPAGDLVFARQGREEDAPVLILPDVVLRLAALRLNDMRSRAVFARPGSRVNSITVRRAGEGIDGNREEEVASTETGAWTLRKPLIYPVYTEGVTDWVGKAKRLALLNFVTDQPENLNLFGLAAPEKQIILKYENGFEDTLLIGQEIRPEMINQLPEGMTKYPESYFAKRVGSPTVFALPKAEVDALTKSLMELRNRQVLRFAPTQVERLVFTQDGREVTVYQPEEGNWRVRNTTGGAAGDDFTTDPLEIYDLIVALGHLEVFEFVKDSPTGLKAYGLDQPAATVTIEENATESEGEPRETTLLLGKQDNGLVYAMLRDQPYIYAVPETFLKYLPKDALELRHKRLFVLQPHRVESVTIERPGEDKLVLTRAPDGLFTSNRGGRTVRAPAAEAVFSLLAQLRAERFVAPGDAVYDREMKEIQETFTIDSTDKRRFVLKVGGKVDDLSLAAEALLPDQTRERFLLSTDDLEFLRQDVFFAAGPAKPAPAE